MMSTTRALAFAAFLIVPVATACTVADDDDESTSDEGEAASVEQAAVEACRTVSKPRLANCSSKLCPSGYYARSCTSTSVRCCRPY